MNSIDAPLSPRPVRSPSTLVVGLLGGVGAGKSTVAQLMSELGAEVLDADRMAQEALAEPIVRAALLERFGHDILGPGGSIDRTALAKRVFGAKKAEERRFLESIVHPRVRERLGRSIEAARSANESRLLVLDAPLILEGSAGDWCDRLVLVDAPLAVRQRRCAVNRSWDSNEHSRREEAQVSVEEKRKSAHHVIVNDGSLADLRFRVLVLLAELESFQSGALPRMEGSARGSNHIGTPGE